MSAQEPEQSLSPQEGLLILASPDGRTIEVRDGDVVGRTVVGKEVLDIHEEISRRHAQFVRNEGTWFVIDLHSSNGTFLDGKRITPQERIPLRNGQQISMSPVFMATVRMKETAIEEVALPSHHDGAEQKQPSRKTMIILFADLKGSVDFFQEKGTIVAQKWILNLYRLLASIISTHRGEHLKNIGDAILAVFDDPHEAARAALEMQADMRRHNSKADKTGEYYLRIGMNMGTVILENRDVFGNAVNIASRVQAVAPPEHIYITQRLYDEVKDDKDMQFRFISHEQLKGVKDKTPIYEIVCGYEKNDGGSEHVL
jgi:class 3 adenylate cyclase